MRLVRSLLLCLLFFSCGSKKNSPDVSDIKININTIRFEKVFFNIDTTNTLMELGKTTNEFSNFNTIFLSNLLKKISNFNIFQNSPVRVLKFIG